MIKLRTLGATDLRGPDLAPINPVVAQPKRFVLLSYLAVETEVRFVRRDKLLALFWPELDDGHARGALSSALYFLKRNLGIDVVSTRGPEDLGIRAETLWCDAVGFTQAVGDGRLVEAAELYQGDFLEGFFAPSAPEAERWIESVRSRLRVTAVETVLGASASLETEGAVSQALDLVRRSLVWAPYEESLVRRVVALLASRGSRAQALREYQSYVRRLREDLEIDASDEMKRLVEALRTSGNGAVQGDNRVISAHRSSGSASHPVVPGGEQDRSERGALPWERLGGRWRAVWLTVAALGATALIGRASVALNGREAAAVTDNQRVVVAPFENRTGDAALEAAGYLAADWIARGLMYSGLVEVVSPDDVVRTVRMIKGEERLWDSGMSQTLAAETTARFVVSGSYHDSGDRVVFSAHISDASTGRMIRAVEGVAGGPDELERTVGELRDRVIGSLATAVDERLASWSSTASQPPTLEAYRLYAEGLDLFLPPQSRPLEAASRFRRAWSLDSTFTAPLIWAVDAYAGIPAARDSILDYLNAARDRLPPWDRAMADHVLASHRDDDPDRAVAAAQRVLKYAPDSEWAFKLAYEAIRANRPREAIDALLRVDPSKGWLQTWGTYWDILCQAYHYSGLYDEELDAAHQWELAFGPGHGIVGEVRALAALGRLSEIEALLLDDTTPASRFTVAAFMALRELKVHGFRDQADLLAARIDTTLRTTRSNTEDAQRGAEYAFLLLEVGRLEEAHEVLVSALEVAEGYWYEANVLGYLGTLAILRSDTATLSTAMDALERLAHEADPSRQGVRPPWRSKQGALFRAEAQILAMLGDSEQAVEKLRRSPDSPINLHLLHSYEPLYDYPPFLELVRPRG